MTTVAAEPTTTTPVETPATTTPPVETPAAATTTTTPPVETPATTPATTPAAATTTAPPSEPARTDGTPPKAPEKYELTLPEQTDFEPTDLQMFEAEARALDLDNEGAQRLVNQRADAVRALKVQYGEEAQADPEIGGAKFDETVRLARVGRDWLFPPNSEGAKLVTGLLDKTALGNHKDVLRAFARIGKAKQEDPAVQPGQQSVKPQQKSLEERLVGA